MKKVTLLIALLLAVLLLSVGALGSAWANVGKEDLSLKMSWIRATPPGAKTTAAYAKIINASDENDTLIAASSDVAKVVELHTVEMKDGMMRMHPVEGGIPVPAKGAVELKPGGYHIMFMGLKRSIAAGEEVSITLTFKKAGEKMVTFKAAKGNKGMKEMKGHGEMGDAKGKSMEKMNMDKKKKKGN